MNRRRYALRDHGERLAIALHVVADGMRLDVDEARRHDVSGRVNARRGPRRAKCSARSHGGDAVATERDVSVVPCGAGAVYDAAVLDHHVVRVASRRGGSHATPGGAGTKDQQEG